MAFPLAWLRRKGKVWGCNKVPQIIHTKKESGKKAKLTYDTHKKKLFTPKYDSVSSGKKNTFQGGKKKEK